MNLESDLNNITSDLRINMETTETKIIEPVIRKYDYILRAGCSHV